jgi:lysophospholipase L1-like esterase
LLPIADEKPIVAYGTSIMNGACASRPGLAWTNILGRKLNAKMINLGFSGNGQLEQPVIDLINGIDAKLYILDCMPNLTLREQFPAAEIERRIRKSVADLQSQHPGVPIVLAEHCSGLEGMNMDSVMTSRYKAASEIAAEVFQKMKKEGIRNIYHLSAVAIGFTTESTVDGTHPNDIGMMQYAEAYEKIIRKIK